MIDKVKVAAIQMVSTANVETNLDIAGSLLRRAAEQEVHLAVLPEYFPIIGDDEEEKLKGRHNALDLHAPAI